MFVASLLRGVRRALATGSQHAAVARRIVVRVAGRPVWASSRASSGAPLSRTPAAAAAAFPSLPPPLTFEARDVGGESVMVATLPAPDGERGDPFFLEHAELAQLRRFVGTRPHRTPQMLMLTGTIKSGKTRVLNTVLPGLLAARLAADPQSRRPVIFLHSFPLSAPAEQAATKLADRLHAFGESVSAALCFPPSLPPVGNGRYALSTFPDTLLTLAKRVHAGNGELWLLFDELQAPLVASTPADAASFVQELKRAVELCAPYARLVGTGSGMVSLLSAIRESAPNGFALWDAILHVRLGREPRPLVARAMAEHIIASYASTRRWPRAFATFFSPERACAELARGKHGELTSARPALIAHLAELVRDGDGDNALQGAAPEAVLALALDALLRKIKEESVTDTLTALVRMQPEARQWLRSLAAQDAPMRKLGPRLAGTNSGRALTMFTSLLCEPTEPPKLMPPYGALLRSLVTRQGELAVTLSDGRLDFAPQLRRSLQLIAEHSGLMATSQNVMNARALAAASATVLAVLAANGVGVIEAGHAARPPQSVTEVRAVPAFVSILAALDEHAERLGKPRGSPSTALLARAVTASPRQQKAFVAALGVSVLVWLRHVDAHAYFATRITEDSGLTVAIIATAVQAASEAIVRKDAAFRFDESGSLEYAVPQARARAVVVRP
jgi:hypothetical protein